MGGHGPRVDAREADPRSQCDIVPRKEDRTLVDKPVDAAAEIEIICPHCGYRMARTAARLRRPHHIACPACGEMVVAQREGEDAKTRSPSDGQG